MDAKTFEFPNEPPRKPAKNGKAPPPAVPQIGFKEFIAMNLPVRGHVLRPVIPEQGLIMIVARRGVGKTHVGLTLAFIIATAGAIFGWKADRPRRITYLDGEMPARTMQDRLRALAASSVKVVADKFFMLVTPDLIDGPLPNLGEPEGQAAIDAAIGDAEVVFIDNLSAWVRSGHENEADSWQSVQDWLLRQRRAGRTIILIHHAGKSGDQRGTSRREDVLDTIITLKHPADYKPSEGARFEVHIDKCRNEVGADLDPFEASLVVDNHGAAVWTTKTLDDARLKNVVELTTLGMNTRDIATDLGIHQSTVVRIQKLARDQGLIGATKKGRPSIGTKGRGAID